jgi:hypothetical protein
VANTAFIEGDMQYMLYSTSKYNWWWGTLNLTDGVFSRQITQIPNYGYPPAFFGLWKLSSGGYYTAANSQEFPMVAINLKTLPISGKFINPKGWAPDGDNNLNTNGLASNEQTVYAWSDNSTIYGANIQTGKKTEPVKAKLPSKASIAAMLFK